jgi:ligand-binding SRPBCC domain-containing protein
MRTHQLQRTQILGISLEEAWRFFTNPANLNEITPASMGFRMLDTIPEKVYPGMIIRYTVKPLLNIPVHWVTEITQVEEKAFFIDDQRVGPYRLWHHQHLFRETAEGVEMTDIVTYALPLGLLGRLAGSLFVHRKVRKIFDYRYHILEKHFKQGTKAP